MTFRSEILAQELGNLLSERLVQTDPASVVSVRLCGVNSSCMVQRGERSGRIACFGITSSWDEYLISFERNGTLCAYGRTRMMAEVVAPVTDWLDGQEVMDLYQHFDFVDSRKRALAAIEAQVIQAQPDLDRCAVHELRHDTCDLYELWFSGKDRSCRVYYYGDNKLPDAIFHWDDCELFRVQTGDFDQLGLVLKRWLCDFAMPSALRKEHPWIEIGALADYYEAGRPIEGEFLASWEGIEEFFGWRIGRLHPARPEILAFIKAIRQAGSDRHLRAGQSLDSLIVSRSRRHGLREDQPSLQFWFGEDGLHVHAPAYGDQLLVLSKIEFGPEVDSLLQELMGKEID